MQAKSFYTHHSSWGSYSSFIMGLTGSGGGFVLSDVKPPSNNIYIGYFRKGEKPKFFPYFTEHAMGLDQQSFDSESLDSIDHSWKTKNTELLKEKDFERQIDWCTETWKSDFVTFKLITPFTNIPDPENLDPDKARLYFAPVIFAELEFDNTSSDKQMTGMFALQGIRRILSDSTSGVLSGGANATYYGFAIKPEKSVTEILSWDVVKSVVTQDTAIHRLGMEGGLLFTINPGQKKKYSLVLGTYQDGFITSYIKSQFYYTYFFSSLEDVLSFGLENMKYYTDIAKKKDKELIDSGLNDSRKFLIAHATRSYLANTEFLVNKKAERIFVVNEGEYQMINTLDLVIDQAFWEMYYTPWTVKNELEFFLKNYSYTDKVKDSSGKVKNGGISFTHDQGVANMFTPKGYSVYELSNLNGCFSYMTHEELLNWLITACIYIFLGNNKDWAKKNTDIFKQILDSIKNRDGNNDGIMDCDSIRCEEGSEITTYDSLDESLGQARNNLYLAVKTWSAYVCLENIFKIFGDDNNIKQSADMASKCAKTIISKYNENEKYIPAVFDNGNVSKIIPAIEGLMYPWIINDKDAVDENGRYKDFIGCLKLHLKSVLTKGICIDKDSGGWKLSSTSYNTWLSKIFLNQYIVRNILNLDNYDWEKWDKVHVSWQVEACKIWAATDQVRSDTGEDLGSRLYPRLVTSFLWFNKWK